MKTTDNILSAIKKHHHVLIGLLVLSGNICWLIQTASLYYSYNYTSVLHYFMVPTWVLIEETIIALSGIIIGFRILKKRIPALRWLIIDIVLTSIAIGISIMAVR